MGEIKTVKCKHCGTEWEMPIGPIMSTPEEFVFPCKCEECGDHYDGFIFHWVQRYGWAL